MIPNERHTDGMNLFSNVREHSLQKLYTTFIGTFYYSIDAVSVINIQI